ncbi:trypsin-like peptidase domain-containing protein [Amycolatopsis eburnea]|uniref:Trypsin-like serine protease n=1 Tax=Amycolatopsis eburnea TaxID=2267691 RepID=A0A3R9KH31_9PSEU|nr:trypsin-like peptidase domain-containing protein [Amycolatopsis eburnea]RSD11985.1 trypsin-like serine protease [Amycolatopsis eburnea]
MNAGNSSRPGPVTDTWVAAIHTSETDFNPIGSGVVIDERRVLTCAHVVLGSRFPESSEIWVAFPRLDTSESASRRRVLKVETGRDSMQDVALLELEKAVPAGVEAARLRCARSSDLVDTNWWAFGFPEGDPYGDSAFGKVGSALGYGWIRIDTASRYLVRPGFSGGGLWSPDYDAVVGLVGQAHANGDGRALTLLQVDKIFPGRGISELSAWSAGVAGDMAMAAWGWSLASDPEGVRHWRPRARGVSIDSEKGYRFRGRTAALSTISRWLGRPAPDRRVLVVTGSPGVGKSAVLGRVITTSDRQTSESLPVSDDALRVPPGSVACAVHAKGKSALEVATEIARAAAAALPGAATDLAPALSDVLDSRGRPRFNVIIDALDEAASPEQARAVLRDVILPLSQTCAASGVQVVIGTRGSDEDGSLIDALGNAAAVIDLDSDAYFEQRDLVSYALACLRLEGDERIDGPYADESVATPVAERIAELAGTNFLIAGLIARSHGLYDRRAVAPNDISVNQTVESALGGYLGRVADVDGVSASDLLSALAFAEAPGLTIMSWSAVVEALFATTVSERSLRKFARSSAANFLVESSVGEDDPSFRLFHQALNETLLMMRKRTTPKNVDERAIAEKLAARGRQLGWANAPRYLLRSLPQHAAAGGVIDDLLADDNYLLHVDIWRLIQASGGARAGRMRRRAQLLGLTQEAASAASHERAALFSVTNAVEHLRTEFSAREPGAPYVARWVQAREGSGGGAGGGSGHQGAVNGVCSVPVGEGKELIASAGADQVVYVWDPVAERQVAALHGHEGWVRGVCSVPVDGEHLVASGGDDRTVRIWNPTTGQPVAVLEGHEGRVSSLCSLVLSDGEVLLASASSDQTVRIWDPAGARQRAVLAGHAGWVRGVCASADQQAPVFATGGDDQTVRIWDAVSGEQRMVLEGHQGWVRAVCFASRNGLPIVASASSDGTVRLWDLRGGEQLAVLEGHRGWVRAVCSLTVAGRELIASAGDDQTVRVWDCASGRQLHVLSGHQGWARGVCSVALPSGETLLASGSDDQTVRLWNPVDGSQRMKFEGFQGWVRGVCRVPGRGGEDSVVSASGSGTISVWNAVTGEQRMVLGGHESGVNGVCVYEGAGGRFLASAGADGTVRLWDLAVGEQRMVLGGHESGVNGVCVYEGAGGRFLASAGADETVRLWDLVTGEQRMVLGGHEAAVNAVDSFVHRGRDLLASAGDDQMVRLWDLTTGSCLLAIPMHHRVLALDVDSQALCLGLSIGVAVLDLGEL